MNSRNTDRMKVDSGGKIRVTDVVAMLKELQREISDAKTKMDIPAAHPVVREEGAGIKDYQTPRTPLTLISNSSGFPRHMPRSTQELHSTDRQFSASTGFPSNSLSLQATANPETIPLRTQRTQQSGLKSLLPKNTPLPEIEELKEIISLLDKLEV